MGNRVSHVTYRLRGWLPNQVKLGAGHWGPDRLPGEMRGTNMQDAGVASAHSCPHACFHQHYNLLTAGEQHGQLRNLGIPGFKHLSNPALLIR